MPMRTHLQAHELAQPTLAFELLERAYSMTDSLTEERRKGIAA